MATVPTSAADQVHDDTTRCGHDGATESHIAEQWRFVVQAEIVNFVALRRQVGKLRAGTIAQEVAERVTEVVAATGVTIVGLRVVEFGLVGDRLNDVTTALEQLRLAFEAPLDINGEPHRVELLFAAAAGPTGRIEEIGLAEEAEQALAQARIEGLCVVRDTTREPRVVDRVTMRRELAEAIERDELFVHYQPKIHVRRQEVTSAEVLIRWQHPRRGLILPNDFISLAEETQLIAPLTLWTLRRVLADNVLLTAAGYDLTLFVNISGQLLNDVDFLDVACRLVTQGPARIGFEITETSVIRDPDGAIRHLEMLAARGVPISIDDYGAGLSSLAYLKKLPATELKIDKMFVMELTRSHRDPLIVRSTIDLAHAMEMEVTAEGVESPAALALLTIMGCDHVQGYLLSRPLSLPAFLQYLASGAAGQIGATSAAYQRSVAVWKAA